MSAGGKESLMMGAESALYMNLKMRYNATKALERL